TPAAAARASRRARAARSRAGAAPPAWAAPLWMPSFSSPPSRLRLLVSVHADAQVVADAGVILARQDQVARLLGPVLDGLAPHAVRAVLVDRADADDLVDQGIARH